MCGRPCNSAVPSVDSGIAFAQFVQQPAPFVFQLSVGRCHFSRISSTAEFGGVECIAALLCFGVDGGEVAVDRGERPRAGAKAGELRVMAVALGAAAQHFARQQGLAPQRDQPLRIEVFGV